MEYETVQRESDNFINFYIATRTSDGAIFEVPCVLDADGNVDTDATQSKMAQHIIQSDEIMSYKGE
jgi:hypothetical protein